MAVAWGAVKMVKNNQGFTLIEVIISIAVLSIAVVSTLSVLAVNYRINARAATRQQVNMLTQEWMEKIKMFTEPDLSGLLRAEAGWRTDGGSYINEFDLAGDKIHLKVVENVSGSGIEVSKLPAYDMEIRVSGDTTIEIDGAVGKVLLIWNGSESNSYSSVITVSNKTAHAANIYIVRESDIAESDLTEAYFNSFPTVKTVLGQVKVHNYMTYSPNEVQKFALDNGLEHYRMAYDITITSYLSLDELNAADEYTKMESSRIAR